MSEDIRQKSTDAELIARAQGGEAEAFGDLYERYLDLIFRYIRTRVSGEEEAEDLTENVFMKAFEALDRYEQRKWPFSSFLYRVARNTVIDHYRTQKDEAPGVEIERMADPAPAPEETVMQTERVMALQETLKALPPDYQEVIRLRIMLELPTSTVAEWMDRKEGAVRALLFRALKALRREVEERDEL